MINRIKGIERKYIYFSLGIITLSFAFNLYNVLTRPIFYDEAWTYLNFTRQGFLTAVSYYPLPNNHILHSVLTVFTRDLPFGLTTNLRLPSLLISVLTAFTFGYTSFRLFGKRVAVVLLTIFCFLFPVAYYGYLSRGYMLVILSFVICYYATIRLLNSAQRDKTNLKYSLILLTSGVIGLYTMPSFVYPLFCCVSLVLGHMLIRGKRGFALRFMGLNSVAALTVFILYAPVMLRSGISSLVNNEMVQPIPRNAVLSRLSAHFADTSEFLFMLPLWGMLLLVLLMLIILFKKGYRPLISIYFLLMPPLLLVIHGVIPFPRTWVYLVVVVLFLLGRFLSSFRMTKLVDLQSIFVVASLVIALLVFKFQRNILVEEFFSYRAQEVAERLADEQAARVYINHPLAEINLRYLFLEQNLPIQIEYSREALDDIEIQKRMSCCDWVLLEEMSAIEVEWKFLTAGDYPMYLGKIKRKD